MKRQIATFFLALISSGVPLVADTFDFTYAIDVNYDPLGPLFVRDHGSGTLTATYQGNDKYLVTAIAGVSSFSGAITGLAPLGAVNNNDNLIFYPGTPYISGNGIGFFTGASTAPDLIYFAGGVYQERVGGSGVFFYDSGTFTITRVNAAPEPAPPVASVLLAGLATYLLWACRLHRKSRTSIRSMPSSSTCV
jgi:hypothetical protein